MAYGTLKCDNITFTNGGSDQTVTVSGIVQSLSGNITATGTIQGATIIGTSTVSGATVTGGVVTITSGVFALGEEALPSISFSSDPDTGIYSPGADQVAISTSGTGRLFVSADGDITWGSGGLLPSSGISGVKLQNSTYPYFTMSSGPDVASRPKFEFVNGNGQVGTITTSGSSTAYNTSSDYRLKENVTPVTDGITRLQQLKPSRFNFIADPDKTVDGFLAHEVQDIVPEAITGEKDAVDDEGNPVYQGIDQSKLVPLLTAALQEAIGEIESLKDRVAALESA